MIKKILMLVLLATPLSLAAQKFAHFNMPEVVQALPAYKTAQTELEDMAKKFETDLNEMRKEITTKMEKYQTEVNESTPGICPETSRSISPVPARFFTAIPPTVPSRQVG